MHPRTHLVEGGAQYQPKLLRLGDHWAATQHVVPLPFDRVQDRWAATREQLDVEREFMVDQFDQRHPALEPLACASHFKAHQLTEFGSEAAISNVFFSHTEFSEALEGQGESSLRVIGYYVLPEVCELKSSAGVVGE